MQLDVELGPAGLDVDLHHITRGARRLSQLHEFDRVPVLESRRNELPGRRIGEVGIEYPVRVSYLPWTPVGRFVLNSVTRA